jgi:hypothetical protein
MNLTRLTTICNDGSNILLLNSDYDNYAIKLDESFNIISKIKLKNTVASGSLPFFSIKDNTGVWFSDLASSRVFKIINDEISISLQIGQGGILGIATTPDYLFVAELGQNGITRIGLSDTDNRITTGIQAQLIKFDESSGLMWFVDANTKSIGVIDPNDKFGFSSIIYSIELETTNIFDFVILDAEVWVTTSNGVVIINKAERRVNSQIFLSKSQICYFSGNHNIIHNSNNKVYISLPHIKSLAVINTATKSVEIINVGFNIDLIHLFNGKIFALDPYADVVLKLDSNAGLLMSSVIEVG